MKVLNLLTSGGVGGIEVLCRDIALNIDVQQTFCFLFGEGIIYDQMKNAGIDVYSFGTDKISIKKFNSLNMIANECDVVVIHHDDPFLQMYYLALMKFCPNKTYISMVHHCYDPVADDLGYGPVKRMIKKWLISRMMIKSDKLIFVSKAGYKSYSDTFDIDDNNVCVIYNGIGESKLKAGRNAEKTKSDVIRLSYVGRLVKIKGVDKIVDVLLRLSSSYMIHLDIVGDGPCREELENTIKKYNLTEIVDFYGYQENINSYLSKADIFIYPSNTEIFGISLVEAMAFKCICVANNVGGIPEIVVDGVNGFLNDDNTVEGLYDAVCEAIMTLKDEIKYKSMLENAMKTAEYFSISRTVSSLQNVYESVAES